MRRVFLPPALFLFLLSGCTVSRSAEVNTPLVNLPNGDQISIQTTQTTGSEWGPGKGPLAIWKHPDGVRKTLITLVPAPGSPVGVLRIESSSPHYSPDASRVWLMRDGQTVASFDYNSGVAILGPAGQPPWAGAADSQTLTPTPPESAPAPNGPAQ